MNQATLYVNGIHCQACVVLIDDILGSVPGVTQAKSDLARKQVVLTGDFTDTPDELAARLTPLIAQHGYTLSTEVANHRTKWNEFTYAVPIAAAIVGLFIGLQKLGLINLIGSGEVSYTTALIIGLVASTSSCLAVVGGLVLSVAAASAKAGGRSSSQFLFHSGRLVGFFILGGALGAIGKSFTLGFYGNLTLSLVVALVMFSLGLNLLEIFPKFQKLRLSLPASFGKIITKNTSLTHMLAPLLLGVATFFLPCGFTQSMQLYTLTTGDFWKGALTMLTFALGTLPVLAVLSFTSFSIMSKPWRGAFFKTTGLVVITLALLNLSQSLAVAGIFPPLISF